MYSVSQLKIVSFPFFETNEASIMIYEADRTIPFGLKRVFTIKATQKCKRGFHAHKKCAQLLVILDGECKITCDDGIERKSIILNNPTEGLLIPPTIWAEQEYLPHTVLMVFTDLLYDENDYIREYKDFLKFRKNQTYSIDEL